MVRKIRLSRLFAHAILGLMSLSMLVPFFWMVSTSLKVREDIFRFPPQIIPNPLYFENYMKVFEVMPTFQALLNSLKVASLATLGTLLTSSLAAYAFAKIPFRGRKIFFAAFLATIMIPGQVTLIPLFITFSRIGWIDTHLPLIVPSVLLNAYGVFLLKQFMEGIPDEYLEAARIEGANHLQIYSRIVMPLCVPPILTLGIFSFIGNWNNFIGPLIFLNSEEKFTLPVIINSFRTVYYVDWGLLMAAACIAVVPALLIYLLTQRFFVEGITLTGLKG